MSRAKKALRDKLRDAVCRRAQWRCEVCGISADKLDPHHITPRELMPNQGMVLSNIIGLCPDCHEIAEDVIDIGTGDSDVWSATDFGHESERLARYSASNLYKLIGSSYERALKDSERLC
jgi:5-methylcytosine-specific restriction endonuclease McrA